MVHRKLTSIARIPLVLMHEAAALEVPRDAPQRQRSPRRHGLADPDGRVPLSVVSSVWRDLLARHPDPALGLRLGRRMDLRSLGIVGYVMATRRTLGDALDGLARYYPLLREGVECRVERNADVTVIVLHDRAAVGWAVRQQVDTRVAAALTVVRELTSEALVPIAVELPYRRPQDLEEHRRTFGTAELRFSRPEAALLLCTADLARPLRSADDMLAGYLDRLATDMLTELHTDPPGGSFAEEVAQVLAATLGSGVVKMDGIGTLLGVSPRTMQRRLHIEGTTFGDVVQRFRRRQAERLLRDRRLTIEQIAGQLGYSEASTFYRAFRRWRRTSPGAFRARLAVRRIDAS